MTKGYKAVYGAFCGLIAFMVWTLSYAAILGVVFKDGRVLEAVLSSNPFAPILQLWYYPTHATLQTAAIFAVAPAVAIGGLVAFLGLREHESPLGDAAFQTIENLRRRRWFGQEGHIFGRFRNKTLRMKDDRHHLIIGPTRSGKGAGYVIPNALMHKGSMIVTDLKGEVWKATAGYRQQNGSRVFLFSPGQEHSHRWNPLDFVRTGPGDRTTDIQNIASILIPEREGSDSGFWQGMAQQVVAGLISYVLESDHYKGRRNLAEVNALLNTSMNLQVLLRLILETETYLSTFTVQSFNFYVALAEKTASSAITEIQNAMRPFKNERIAAATSVTDIDLASMKRRPISLYLAPNITDITLLRPLLTLFVQQVMNLLTLEHDRDSVPVYFLLDEFRQLKRMDEIMNKLPYVAGYNIKLAFIIQDLKNLDEIYGETSRFSMLGNCGYQLILGANDQATAEYVSKALGKQTIRYHSESRTIELIGLPKRTRVEQIRERDLMMPQEVRQMPENKAVLLVEGQPPIFANKLRFFDTEPFKAAEAFSQANVPDVPQVELQQMKPVPALTDAYKKRKSSESDTTTNAALAVTVTVAEMDAGTISPVVPVAQKEHKPDADPASPKTPLDARQVEADKTVVAPQGGEPDAEAVLTKLHAKQSDLQASAVDLFGEAVSAAKKLPARKRKPILDIFQATIPDPEGFGLLPLTETVPAA